MATRDEPQPTNVDQLLPDDDGTLTAAQEAGLLASDSLESPSIILESPPPASIGKSYAFDFAHGHFYPNVSGGVQATVGLTTLRYWVEKCLNTPKGAFPIHDDDYGLEGMDEIIGRQFDAGTVANLGQWVTDALLYHPNISRVVGFQAAQDPSDETLFVSFTVVTDQGDTVAFEDLSLA